VSAHKNNAQYEDEITANEQRPATPASWYRRSICTRLREGSTVLDQQVSLYAVRATTTQPQALILLQCGTVGTETPSGWILNDAGVHHVSDSWCTSLIRTRNLEKVVVVGGDDRLRSSQSRDELDHNCSHALVVGRFRERGSTTTTSGQCAADSSA
jgi:hypothetical protein